MTGGRGVGGGGAADIYGNYMGARLTLIKTESCVIMKSSKKKIQFNSNQFSKGLWYNTNDNLNFIGS